MSVLDRIDLMLGICFAVGVLVIFGLIQNEIESAKRYREHIRAHKELKRQQEARASACKNSDEVSD